MQSVSNSLSPLISKLNVSQPISCRLFFSTPNLIYWIFHRSSNPNEIIKSGISDVDPQNGVSRKEEHFASVPFTLNSHPYAVSLGDVYPVASSRLCDL